MKAIMQEFSVPGVLWIIVLTGLGIAVAFTYPQYAVLVPIVFGAVSYLINQFAPPDSRIRELIELIRDLTTVQEASEVSPEEKAQALAAQQRAEELVERNKLGKILWG